MHLKTIFIAVVALSLAFLGFKTYGCYFGPKSLKVSYSNVFPLGGIHGGGEYIGKVGCQKFHGIIGKPPYYVTATNWGGFVFVTSFMDRSMGGRIQSIVHVYSSHTGAVDSIKLNAAIYGGPGSGDGFKVDYLGGDLFNLVSEDRYWHVEITFNRRLKTIAKTIQNRM